jgi:hypothetical protein
LRHGVLLVVGAPGQLRSLAGQEHGRTIPLASLYDNQLPHCDKVYSITSPAPPVRPAQTPLHRNIWIRPG